MATTNLERLPRSLQNNKYAQSLAKKLDNKTAQVSTLKETANRPGRGKRALSGSIGALLVGGTAGLVESNAAKAGIGIVGGGIIAASGAFMDSDAIFDAGMGAVQGGLFVASGVGTSKLKEKVLASTGEDDPEQDPDVIDAE